MTKPKWRMPNEPRTMHDKSRPDPPRNFVLPASSFIRHSTFGFRHFLGGILVFLLTFNLRAAEVIPPAPPHYFNDNAGVVAKQVADNLNTQLKDFEQATSNQIAVAIYPKMQTASSIEDYAQHIFEAWKPGQKKLNNGAILLVFTQDHKMRIQTGYGLEGALPDALCKQIIEDEIAPRFKAGDFNGGMTAGVKAMMAAAKGEYKGTGRTHRQEKGKSGPPMIVFIFIFGFVIVHILSRLRRAKATQFGSAGRRSWNQGWYIDTSGGGSGGGWSGGGGSDFSGGGGDSGGGGASGSW